jgi:chitodextrinase
LLKGTVTLNATASDSHSGIQRVEFLDGTTVLGSDTSSPYSFSWNTTTATNGSHNLTARAFDNAGNSTTSSPSVAVTVDNQAPTVPGNLRTTNVVYNQVALAWNASTDNVALARYWVIRNGSQIAQVTTTSYTDNSVLPLTAYTYQITAEDTAGNTSTSTSLNVNTPAAPDSVPPSQPSGLVAVSPTYYQMNLTWTPSTDNIGVTKYDVFRDGADIADVSTCSTSCSFGDTNLNFNTSYAYHVVAYDANGNASTPSATVTKNTLKIGDLDEDTDIDIFDLSALLTLWNSANIRADLNRNGKVDIWDLSMLLSNWAR